MHTPTHPQKRITIARADSEILRALEPIFATQTGDTPLAHRNRLVARAIRTLAYYAVWPRQFDHEPPDGMEVLLAVSIVTHLYPPPKGER